MAAGLGIAAGAFAQNYANAMGLRSRLDAEKQQQELNEIKLTREKEFQQLQSELSAAQKNFLNPEFDYVSGKAYDPPQPGITPEGQQRPKDVWADPTRVNAHYNTMGALLERQAVLSGKNPLEVRREMENLRKDRFVERVGSALSMIEAGDDAGIKQLQAVYDLMPDGRKVTGGKINQDGTVLLQYEQDGKPGERLITREQLLNYGKLALNPADAVKLRYQLIEKEKDRAHQTNERLGGEAFTGTQNQLNREQQTKEGDANRSNALTLQREEQSFKRPFLQSQADTARISAGAAATSANAAVQRAQTANRLAEAQIRNLDDTRAAAANAKIEGDAQKSFFNAFGVSDFKVKPEEEVKALLPSQKQAYVSAREKAERARARANAGQGIWELNGRKLNPGFITSVMPEIEKRIMAGKTDGVDEATGLPYMTINGKKVIVPQD